MPWSFLFTDLPLAASDASAWSMAWNFLRAGGVFMLFIGACSLLAVSVAIYKFLELRRHLVLPSDIVHELENIEAYVDQGSVEPLLHRLNASPSPLARAAAGAMSGTYLDKSEALEAAHSRGREEVVRMERGIAVLEVVITIAPLLGLLGTVSGLVSVFGVLGDAGLDESSPAELARGIAMALNTTIAGLAVAVPTVIAHSYFTRRIEAIAARMEVLLNHALSMFFNFFQIEVMPHGHAAAGPAAETATAAPAGSVARH